MSDMYSTHLCRYGFGESLNEEIQSVKCSEHKRFISTRNGLTAPLGPHNKKQ
jgi:hypothetical protein